MEKFASYVLREKIHETRHSIIYRGYKENESVPVVIKLLKTTYPTPSEIARFRQEYDLIIHLDIEGIVKAYDLVEDTNRYAIIEEDFNGVSLRKFIKSQKIDIKSFLQIAEKISKTLGLIHKNNIIHLDIKPDNVLLNTKQDIVKIADFGISATLTHANEELYNPEVIEGTLPYISPEQTGRMNRNVDYRTDLYSLGITFYEMLTGNVPFQSKDPMELIHSHIARTPAAPESISSSIPSVVSEIIMKLLLKNPEDRYQNAFGLAADIRRCIKQLDEHGTVGQFELCRRDISSKFIIPLKLYGRGKEIDKLISNFESVAYSNVDVVLMVVSGVPGIGKSSLINEIQKPIVSRRGYFISGKYDQFRKDVPYSAIIQAFQALVKQILSESEGKIGVWKKELLEALTVNGRVITEVIPEVELIIGKQPKLPVLGAEESKNRFIFVFEKFIGVFLKKEHPVTLCLEDLQWADLASLQLIKNILTSSNIKYLYMIISYRDDEVDESHLVTNFLKEVEKNNVRTYEIRLEPLTATDITDLIVNFLRCSRDKSAGFANIVHKKTGGNPFFMSQFFYTLYNEKIITFDDELGWRWNEARVNAMKVTDNIVEIMAGKIGKLSGATKDVLKICACIGNRFDLETLASVGRKSVDTTLADLRGAISEGLVSSLGDNYIFHHDRIREVAYSLMTDVEKSELHYKIGKLSLDSADENALQKKLFYIVDQLNKGFTVMKDAVEREKLARLNLNAGEKAKASASYELALLYLKYGIGFLGENSWKNHYKLTLDLHAEATEVAYLMGDFDTMNKIADIALNNAKTTLDKIRIYVSKINSCVVREDYQGAINVALPVLKILGLRLPKKATPLHVGIELMKFKFWLHGRKPEDIINMPKLTDPEKLAVLKIIASIGHSTFYMEPNMLALNILKGMRMSRYGLAPDISFGFASYGIILAAGLWDFKGGLEAGQIALKLIDKMDAREQKCRTLFVYNAIVRHWSVPLRDTIIPMMEGYRSGRETGDLGFASFNLFLSDVHSLLSGTELSKLDSVMSKNNQIIAGLNQQYTRTLHSLTWQAVLNIRGQSDDPLKVSGKVIEAESLLPSWKSANNLPALSVFWFVQLVLYTLYNEHSLAIKASDNFKSYKASMQGIVINRYAVLCDSMSRLFMYKNASLSEKMKYRAQIMINQLKMKKWAASSPTNALHLYHGVEAMRAWLIRGNNKKAEELFELAINLCKKHDDIIIESIASEYAVKFFQSIGNEKKANEYKAAAYSGYSKWGATALINKLTKMYPDVVKISDKAIHDTSTSTLHDSPTTTGTQREALDFATVIKTSQTLSSDIELGKLLANIMKLSIENAGAQRGFLIMENEKDQKLYIEAMGKVDSTVDVLKSIPLEEGDSLSVAIVNYVKKTGENIVLGDAASDERFINDSYIVTKHPKSILCAPIRYKGTTAGIIYLENNLTTHAFTPDRLKLLQIFSAQAAIAIENAILYKKLRMSEESLKESFENLNKVFATTVNAMSLAIEARDPYTAGHQRRVADLATAIASELKLPPKTIDGIRIAGIIHDIGKISIPAELLTKPGKLTKLEFDLIKSHPRSGYEILQPIAFPWPIAQIVHQHHERLNGSGYPLGLTEKDVLMESKIISVADVVEAMASHRPYRASLGIDKALEEISLNSGILYDSRIVDVCLKLFREKNYQLL